MCIIIPPTSVLSYIRILCLSRNIAKRYVPARPVTKCFQHCTWSWLNFNCRFGIFITFSDSSSWLCATYSSVFAIIFKLTLLILFVVKNYKRPIIIACALLSFVCVSHF